MISDGELNLLEALMYRMLLSIRHVVFKEQGVFWKEELYQKCDLGLQCNMVPVISTSVHIY